MSADTRVEAIATSAFTVPTEKPESDGTLEWDRTTIVVVHVTAGGVTSVGYSYANVATAQLIDETLAPRVTGCDAMATGVAWQQMMRAVRNLGQRGIASMAVAAVDNALWDLKGRLLNLSVAALLPMARRDVMAYGSGGFTSFSESELVDQMSSWARDGLHAVKMKIGRDAAADIARVKAVRSAIGPKTKLFVDANGAYSRKQALRQAEEFREADVSWFEEPVSSNDLCGLRMLRDRAPAGMDIAAGEYGYTAGYFEGMLNAGAVDVLQADATRCGGITGFLQADALCEAHEVPLSSHTAPTIHAHACCAAKRAIHAEYFSDHVRIEKMAFDGAIEAKNGVLNPDLSRPGLGLEWKTADMARYQVYGSPSHKRGS